MASRTTTRPGSTSRTTPPGCSPGAAAGLLEGASGGHAVASGGLKVYTTCDPKAQHAAEAAVARGLEDIEKNASFVGARKRESAKRAKTAAPVVVRAAATTSTVTKDAQ